MMENFLITVTRSKTTITIPPLADVRSVEHSEGKSLVSFPRTMLIGRSSAQPGTGPSSPVLDEPSSPSLSAIHGSTSNGLVTDVAMSEAGQPDAANNAAATVVPVESLLNTAQPRYPLPSRPFAVQALPKVPNGYAPVVPLDRTKLAPRHWRQAQREIRGIAGGRWFIRAWVGDKESPLINAHSHAGPPQEPFSLTSISASMLNLPKLTAPPSITSGSKRGKASGTSSRADSVAPPSAPALSQGASASAPPQLAKRKSGLSMAAAITADDTDEVVSVDGGA
jgi:hypothetical protein